MSENKIIVTAALPYANGPIHLGHLAGAYLPADIYVRYQRLRGRDILFICGSDEHGVPITITADNEKVTPKVVIDRFHGINKSSFDKFGMSFDIYSRTSIDIHHETVKEFFLNFFQRGLFTESKTKQFYDEEKKMFLPDRYVEGVCPNCGFEGARSDECENCGALYEPGDLKNPVSKLSGKTPVLKETSHWYFPLNHYQQRLEEYIKEHDKKYGWKDNVLQYCRSWFNDGLRERAITRDLDWGVKLPVEGGEGKVIYVWFEAVLGYISATRELFMQRGEADGWKEYWQNPDTRYIAFIGKDNIVFHTIMFPAMLMAWNDGNESKYVLPENVPANEFLNFEGKKFSKSRKWGIDVIDFLNEFDADSLRYTLALNLPEYRDTDFSWADFQAKHNNELSNILGNLVNRTFTFVHKNFEGKVPSMYSFNEMDNEMLNLLEDYPAKIADLIEEYKFKDATLEIMNLARAGNKYFNDSEPWKSIKNDPERAATSLNICLQTIYTIGELFMPVIPGTSEKIFHMLNARPTEWENCGKINLAEGHQLNPAVLLFTKIEDSKIEEQRNKTANPDASGDENAEPQNIITIDDFFRTELVVAKVLEAEKVKGSEKLLKLKVSTGKERQIVSGIAKYYSPEQMVGKKVLIVSNLKPAKIMGLESQGMILAVESNEGNLKIVEIDQSIPEGTRAK